MPEETLPQVKTCSKCGETKPIERFGRRADKPTSRCRDCLNAASKAWRLANADRVAANNKRWREKNADRMAALKLRWESENPRSLVAANRRHRERHPEKAIARNRIKDAVRTGAVEKPAACEECGDIPPKLSEIHAHHDDYSKPLDVRWLCRSCHYRAHGKTLRA